MADLSFLWAGSCVGGLATHYVSIAFDNDHIRSLSQLVTHQVIEGFEHHHHHHHHHHDYYYYYYYYYND